MDLVHDPLFRLYAASCLALGLFLGVLGLVTAIRRRRYGSPSNPEDVAALGLAQRGEGDHPEVARVIRAHRNALETIPVFFALGLVLVLARGNVVGGALSFGVFTVARVLHAVFYLRQAQPARTIAFLVGQASLLALVAQIAYAIV